MDHFALNLLGPPSLEPQRGPVARGVGVTKGLALLAYLALEPGPHRREELATLLWGDSPDPAARASLRQALKRLRAALGEGLYVDRTTVELRGSVECDVSAFLEAARSAPRVAAGFDVPHFLAGFTVPRAGGFEDWTARKREELVRHYRAVLAGLAHEAFAQAQWRDAVDWADRWSACDPLSEDAVRVAIEALYLSGDRGGALTRFAEYRERLSRDVGAKPSAALLELAERIGAEAGPARPVARREPAPTGGPSPSFEASLVGREAEWAEWQNAWQAVRRGVGRVVLIQGEAGVGKTRLAEELLRWAALEGAIALRGRGYDAQTDIPFFPVVEVLRSVLEAPGLAGTAPELLAEVTRLLPELRRRFPGLPQPVAAGPGERWGVFEGTAQAILSVAAERPVVICIDDLQWCDGETCALLDFLSRRFERCPVAVVAALTLGELDRDAPAAHLAGALRARGSVVTLAPLTEEQVWHLIRELGRIATPAGGRRLARRLHQVTDGNPFHVIELLKTLFAQGLLVVDPATGGWVAAVRPEGGTLPDVALPSSVQEAILQRVTRLPYELRDLLATIAVVDRGATAELLSHVHGMSRLRVAALSDALVERRLLVEEDGLYRCAHPVIAAVVRRSLTPARRRELHRAAALSLATIAETGDVTRAAGQIARHAHRGGERAVAYRYALAASDAAADRHAFEEALYWLELAGETTAEGAEADQVKRRTASLLQRAGWSAAPSGRGARRRSSGAPAIERRDLDVGGVEPR